MRIIESKDYPLALEVVVDNSEEEIRLRGFVEGKTLKSSPEPVEVDGGNDDLKDLLEKEAESKPDKGLRSLSEDRETPPGDIAVQHCVKTAISEGMTTVADVLEHIYGEVPFHTCTLFKQFKREFHRQFGDD